MKFFSKTLIAGLVLASGLSAAQAGVVIGGTRVIYDGNKKEASLSVNNPDNVPYLIQSWVETQTGGAEKAPFIITPPLYRLDKSQQNIMRIVRAGTLPENKESLYWLNIKAIPSAARNENVNTLQVAVKTRIKLIYRPAALKNGSPEDQANTLRWSCVGNSVEVTNPSAYYINFNSITVNGKALNDVTYVAPGASARFNLPAGAGGGKLSFKIISDYGAPGAEHNVSI